MADASRDEQLAQFQSITGCDSERAQFYLESSNWQLDLAMASFYEGDGDMDVAAEPVGPAGADPAPPVPAPAAAAGKINIVGGANDDDDSDEEEGQSFFAGGSTHSGTNILGPNKKKMTNVSDFFKAFKEAGAVPVDPSEEGASGSSGVKAFSGGGFRLGSDETPSMKIGSNAPAAGASKEGPKKFVLKMWRDGFSLDDGDIRRYNDPEHREFLASVLKGQIPDELVKEARGGEVNVDMEDHREEEFVKPKVKAKPFQGAGNVLGSIAPSVAAPEANPSLDPAAAEKAAQQKVNLNESNPVANIQVRLADGSRLIVKLNHNHTVADLRSYINVARPQYNGVGYNLLTTFPNKEITDDSATISSAGLVGAAVLQRLK